MVRRRFLLPASIVLVLLFVFYTWPAGDGDWLKSAISNKFDANVIKDDKYFWRKRITHFPIEEIKQFPTGVPLKLPNIQTTFPPEGKQERTTRLERQQTVKNAFSRCWSSYKNKAFMRDELAPLSGKARDTSAGWGATLVDSLDTLHIMGMHDEFEEAVAAAAKIDFEKSSLKTVNTFETTVRYLGGFLSAYDLSGDQRLLRKAREAGDMIYAAFDTPNRMPITRWDFGAAQRGEKQEASDNALIAEVGSYCMEFTRLSLVTGDPRWYDAAERIREVLQEQQNTTLLPGMWPITVSPGNKEFNRDNTFTLGAMSDSTYEYLPKMHALVGGLIPEYQSMYETAMETALSVNFFRPLLPYSPDILISGSVHANDAWGQTSYELEAHGQHLVCFVGGMLAVGGRLFDKPEHLTVAKKLVDGCIWTYTAMPLGIMPETFYMVPCKAGEKCDWDASVWKEEVLQQANEENVRDMEKADARIAKYSLPKGFTEISEVKYHLRSEAIESIFVLYRATGNKDLLDTAWKMFQTIQKHTETKLANGGVGDVTVSDRAPKLDAMESHWMGETLKYFYLMFSESDFISLDEWVFNTKAHPFKRLVRS
ncbi:Uu.00g039110.m01.CDS01 [Anthostomella pinea]|uniref:alpha-1,2-Mannosidase n=1 Tax=Anthostomella pinea TaxID=933095 RepID=A0AAI8VA23_9PEZI|nr:Uu.00g039110.m01.CDS01 [Anthostomella pinea]